MEPLPEITYPFIVDTIGKLIAAEQTLRVHCQACDRHAVPDLHALAERLGVNHPCMHGDLVPKLKCSKCGGKRLGLTIAPPTTAPGVKR